MASVGTVYMDVKYNTAQVTKDLTAASSLAGTKAAAALTQTFDRRLEALGGKTADVGKKMSIGLSLPLVGLGALATREFLGYEKSLTNIQGLVGASREQTQAYGDDIRRIGVEFGVGAQAAGEALYFITSSGFEGAAAIEVLEESSKAAASGLGELPVVADLVTSAINAYGSANLSAAQATDILTAAVKEGKGDPAELAGAMSSVLPVASALGVRFDEVSGAMASMSLTGTSADEAATQLRGILNAINKPSKQAEEALNDVGLSSAYLRDQIAEKGLLPVLKELVVTLGDDSAATALVFEDVRALTGVMNILGEKTAQTEAIFKSTANSTGTLNDAFDVTKESAGFQLKQAMEELNDALIDVGVVVVPILTKVAQGVAVLAEGFSKLPGPVQTVIVGLAGVAAAIGPVLFVGGKLVQTFGKMVGVAEKFANAGISKALDGLGSQAQVADTRVTRLGGSMSKLGAVGLGLSFAGAAAGLYILTQRLQENKRAADEWASSIGANGTVQEQLNEKMAVAAALQQDLIDNYPSLNAFGGEIFFTSDEGREKQDQLDALNAEIAELEGQLDAYNNTQGLTARGVDQFGNKLEDTAASSETAKKAFDEQRAAVSGLQSVFLGAIDGGTAYQDALDGIVDAQRASDQATRRVSDAQRGYRDALRSVEDAQDSYAESLQGVADAQQDVIDAQRALDEALSGPSVDDELSLEGARIRLEEAQRTMNEGDFEDDLDRRRAALALRQAEVDLARLEEQVAGRPAERALELADAQGRLVVAQSSAEDAARGVQQANEGVAQAAQQVRDAQYDQAEASVAVAEAKDTAARSAIELYGRTKDLETAMRDEEGAASDLLGELLFLQGAYPELAAAIQPYIDKLRILQALKAAASNPNIGKPFPANSGFTGPQGAGPQSNVGVPFSPESGLTGPMGAGVVVNGYHRAPEDIVNEIDQRQQQAVSGLGVF